MAPFRPNLHFRSPIMIRSAFAAISLAALAGCATVALEPDTCPSDARVADMVKRYVALEPVPNPLVPMTADGARCGAEKFVRQLDAPYGRVVGYKAALTNPAVQKRFGVDAPVRGSLLDRMILRDGVEVPAKFGARPLYEADLVVVVRDAGIHDAATPAEVLQHLIAIHPFIELADLVVEDPAKVNAPVLTLINAGSRAGVLGAAIPVRDHAGLETALRDMRVRVQDGQGNAIDAGRGSDVLGHPLNAVIWLAADLKRSGLTLKAGDIVSLGSFSKLLPPKAGTSARVIYEGLPGNPSVSVRFR